MRKKIIVGVLFLAGMLLCYKVSVPALGFYVITTTISWLFVNLYYKQIEKKDSFNLLILDTIWFPVFRYFAITYVGDNLYQFWNHIINQLNRQPYLEFPEVNKEGSVWITSILLLVIASVVFHFVNKDRTGMKKVSVSVKKDFPESDFTGRREIFCRNMITNLENINEELNWSNEYFTPLNAEIQLLIKNKIRKRTGDLLKALKAGNKKSNGIYLVIGEPGSGKSVTLRKLCVDLMEEVKKTGKIPVYINLKEWSYVWDIDKFPTEKDIEKFVVDYLLKNGNVSIGNFMNDYYSRLLNSGRWFFIFDSFDEIPCLIGAPEGGLINTKLSEAIYSFITNSNCSGIVASRPFRSPTKEYKYNVMMNIQPYSDRKIGLFFQNYGPDSSISIKKIYSERYDLIQTSRNPFFASLVCNYLKCNNKYPQNQCELFENFIDNRLNQSEMFMQELGIDKMKVKWSAQLIAYYMFANTNAGLEARTKDIKDAFNIDEEFENAVKVLTYAKLCRMNKKDKTITFVHRRFQEYFYVVSNIEFRAEAYKDIPNNSRYRDALVLYCEIADSVHAKAIAEFCWAIIRNNGTNYHNINDKKCMEAVNCLNFLSEAFQRRKNVLYFQEELSSLINESLQEKQDFICISSFAHAINIFSQNSVVWIANNIFKIKNTWLDEIVINNIINIVNVHGSLVCSLDSYIDRIHSAQFLKRFKDFMFLFSITKSFQKVKKYTIWKLSEILLAAMLFIFLFYLFIALQIPDAINYKAFLFSCLYFIIILNFNYAFEFNNSITETVVRALNIVIIFSIIDVALQYSFWSVLLRIFILLYLFPPRMFYKWRLEKKYDYFFHQTISNHSFLFEFLIYAFILNFILYFWGKYRYVSILFICFAVLSNAISITVGYLGPLIISLFIYLNYRKKKSFDKQELEKILSRMKNKSLRRKFLKQLKKNRVKLSGTWKDDVRPYFQDDISTMLLIEIDTGRNVLYK